MKLSDKQFEFLKDVALLILFCERLGIKVTGGELWRPDEMQRIYLDKGLTKTLNSDHQKKLAIDLNFFIEGQYIGSWDMLTQKEAIQQIGDFWESLRPENYWGGNWETFIDIPHFGRKE